MTAKGYNPKWYKAWAALAVLCLFGLAWWAGVLREVSMFLFTLACIGLGLGFLGWIAEKAIDLLMRIRGNE